MELHEKIAAMRTYIAEHGFCKFQTKDAMGRVCLSGADIETGWVLQTDVFGFLSALAIELRLVEPNTTLKTPFGIRMTYPPSQAAMAFNNHSDTTENDMLNFLHIAEIRAKELAQ
jgi:hypothetical protein